MVEDLINPRHLSHWGSRSETASRPRPNPAPSPVTVPFAAISLPLSLVLLLLLLATSQSTWRRGVLLAACLIDCRTRSHSWTRRRSRNCWNRCQIVEHFVLLSFYSVFGVFIYFSMCASPVVLLLSFVFFCCGSLTVRFRVSVKYFASPPDEGTPLSTRMHLYFRFIDL